MTMKNHSDLHLGGSQKYEQKETTQKRDLQSREE